MLAVIIVVGVASSKKKPTQTHTEANKTPYNNIDKLTKLKELLDAGAITQEEFDQKKREILNCFNIVQRKNLKPFSSTVITLIAIVVIAITDFSNLFIILTITSTIHCFLSIPILLYNNYTKNFS